MSEYFGEALKRAAQAARLVQRRNDSVYPSDASVEIQVGDRTEIHGTCLRKQWYRLTGVPQSNPEDQYDNFVASVGEAVHDQVGRVFQQAEQLVLAEQSIYLEDIRLSGRIDLIIRPQSDGEMVGVEIKSVGGYHGSKGVIKATRDKPFYPRLYHLAQTVVYAEYFKDKFTTWVILYVDRETGRFKEHLIQYRGHDDIWVNGEPSTITPKAVYDRWERLWRDIATETRPKRDYWLRYPDEHIQYLAAAGGLNKDDMARVAAGRKVDKGDIQCREFCQWRDQCWKTDKDA
jgi:CRISPR/Cas system-associated exonuclease Cas4 (RecB family)